MAAQPDALSADAALAQLEPHRRELTGYCYRMLGSAFEAEDAVQETFVRAWRNVDSFEGRSSLRSWAYRIATNVCLDMLRSRQRRTRPMDLEGPSTADRPLTPAAPEHLWLEPIPDSSVLPEAGDPADVTAARESIKLAFVAALQHLPPKQRAALILCEVLRWQAAEVAELLDTSVASVNSALQRARATLATSSDRSATVDEAQRELLERYVDAFERYDMDLLVTLLHTDAVQNMPPYPMWLQGADQVVAWMLGTGAGCRGSRLLPVTANGMPAFGQYRVDPAGGHAPWALQVLDVVDGRIAMISSFLNTRLFERFGLPAHLA